MRHRRIGRMVGAAVALIFIATACSADNDGADNTSAGSVPEATDSTVAANAVPAGVPAALQFSADAVGGGTIDVASLAGKPTVLWFWAPWCSICNREAEDIEATAQQFAGDVNFVGVAWSGSEGEFQGFIDDHGLTFPQISDDPGEIYEKFGIAYQPALVIVKADGSTERVAGSVDPSLLQQIISEA
jgi:peroxiredoxin